MEYISTRDKKRIFLFKNVFLKGLAPDGGLFVPKNIPLISSEEFKKFRKLSYKELAVEIISKFCSDEFNENEIIDLVEKSYNNFRVKDVVVIRKSGDINLLELFHGPTLAFKDIALQLIGNMYEKILKKNNSKINIVVATSGDTGAAAISAVKNRKNIKIFVLHPDNKVSQVQRKFMTTVNANNVFNIAVAGNFDECQKLVKSMFADKKFNSAINMSGVNSINWSRIAAQVVYYFFSYFKLTKDREKINFCVPTGNFGDIYAGYVAKKMGLPVNKLIIATNKNDILKRVFDTGIYRPLEVKHTVSPSMDIQIASNFERLIFDVHNCDSDTTIKLMNDLDKNGEFKIEKNTLNKIKENFSSESLTDNETKLTIKEFYQNHKVLIDPHTAIGVGVANKLNMSAKTIILSTAHPSKFAEVVSGETSLHPDLPENLEDTMTAKEKYEKLPKDLQKIKNYILSKVND